LSWQKHVTFPESLAAPAARTAALQKIAALTCTFPYYAQPRAVELTLDPWGAGAA